MTPELDGFDDAQLMVLFQHGREDAFEALFHRHQAGLYRFLCRMSGGTGDAEELLQEVFLRVARAAPQYEPRAAFTTWLYRIALNRCRSWRRRGGLVLLRLEEESSPRSGPDPARIAEERQGRRDLEELVGRLPEPLRSAFLLREVQGFSTREAGEILGMAPATVRTHVHRARLTLRRWLEPAGAADGLRSAGGRSDPS